MSEQKRGCGFRKIGGLYLVCDPGFALDCDGLPLELEQCVCCGFKPPFSRNLQKIQALYLLMREVEHHAEHDNAKCQCLSQCPICHIPAHVRHASEIYGLMFVGKQSYTPNSFIKEAFQMGVSKRIPEIPAWLKLRETWILLAHQKVPKVTLEDLKKNELHTKEPEYIQAVFYAFQPQRVELVCWKGQLSNDQILKLEKKGITPVFLEYSPENRKRNKNAKSFPWDLMK
jgi:hypothetical protein